VSWNYIGMVERGETNPTLLVLHSLAKALETTMVSVISEVEPEDGTRSAGGEGG
jgi:transcriptional regulator with XRE-family HTH domain